jgi:DNA mismatch endonuclease (patch repair protein)
VPVACELPAIRPCVHAIDPIQRAVIAVDTLTVAERSERMSRIRSKDTKPEMLVRRLLHKLGYRYRLHRRDLPGIPDLVFPSRKKVIFVHGCFWHAHSRCSVANVPKSRRPFWRAKFSRNKRRDGSNERLLRRDGWHVFTVWECETKDMASLMLRLSECLGPPKTVP